MTGASVALLTALKTSLYGLLTRETAIPAAEQRHLSEAHVKGVERNMRKMILLAVTVSACMLIGLAAAAKPKSVTISLSKPSVVYGGSVTLSGAVSNHQAGELVIVTGRESGTTTFTQVNVATTAAKGAWSYAATPQIQTSYKAQWGTAFSKAVTVKVRPRIRLTLDSRTARRGTFSVEVDGNRPFTGKRVLIQRLTADGPTTVKRATLGASSTATFTLRLPRHRARVRVVMSASQAAPGYIAGYSNVWRSS